MDDRLKASSSLPEAKLDTTLEEFSIMELDERLEFVAWCDNCSCVPQPQPTE
jgi:hypothetical protein